MNKIIVIGFVIFSTALSAGLAHPRAGLNPKRTLDKFESLIAEHSGGSPVNSNWWLQMTAQFGFEIFETEKTLKPEAYLRLVRRYDELLLRSMQLRLTSSASDVLFSPQLFETLGMRTMPVAANRYHQPWVRPIVSAVEMVDRSFLHLPQESDLLEKFAESMKAAYGFEPDAYRATDVKSVHALKLLAHIADQVMPSLDPTARYTLKVKGSFVESGFSKFSQYFHPEIAKLLMGLQFSVSNGDQYVLDIEPIRNVLNRVQNPFQAVVVNTLLRLNRPPLPGGIELIKDSESAIEALGRTLEIKKNVGQEVVNRRMKKSYTSDWRMTVKTAAQALTALDFLNYSSGISGSDLVGFSGIRSDKDFLAAAQYGRNKPLGSLKTYWQLSVAERKQCQVWLEAL